MEIIAFFDYENKKFLVTRHGEKLIYSIRENGINRLEINEDEEKIFKRVLSSLVCNPKKQIFIKHIEVNNKAHKLLYYPKNNLYFTDSMDEEVVEHINLNYNLMPNTMLVENDLNEENNKQSGKQNKGFFNRLIKLGRKIVSVGVLATLSLAALTGYSIETRAADISSVPRITRSVETTIEEEQAQGYDFARIEKALDKNTHLKTEEKNFIKGLEFAYERQKDYMDLDLIEDRLATLQIKYLKEPQYFGGAYENDRNIITVANATGFEDANKNVLSHETNHVNQINSNAFAHELATEEASRENNLIRHKRGDFTDKDLDIASYPNTIIYGKGYEEYMPFYYALLELVPREKSIEFLATGNVTVLVDVLADENGDKSKAHEFFTNLDTAREFNPRKNYYEVVKSPERRYETFKNTLKSLNDLYMMKKGCEIKDDLRAAILFHNLDIGIGFSIFNNEEKAELKEFMTNAVREQTGLEDYNWGATMVVIPKTYLGDEEPEHIMKFCSGTDYETVHEFRLTDEIIEKYKASRPQRVTQVQEEVKEEIPNESNEEIKEETVVENEQSVEENQIIEDDLVIE